MTKNEWKGHGAMWGAEVMWGLMAPVSKLVLASAVTPLLLTDCRMLGAACLFWLASVFTKPEHVASKDLLLLFFASLLGIVFNQGSFIFGLSLTSPINAGVFLGALGALLLIVSGQQNAAGNSNIWGDLLCLLAQLSFSFYLVLYKGLTARYSPITLMKWMFTYASICLIPFSYPEILSTDWLSLGGSVLTGLVAVVFCATFISYLLIPLGQRYLRPTVTSMYNYIQPIVASSVAIYWGMDHFNMLKVLAVILVFTGVFFVTTSRSRADLEKKGMKDLKETAR